MQHGKLRTDRGSWLVSEFFFQFSLLNINNTFKAGEQSSYVFLKLVYLTTVSSNSETRAREDLCGIDSYPVCVSSSHVERNERRDPLTKPTKNPGDISQRRRIYFSTRRWTNQNTRRRSGTENIHLGTASANSRRE